MRLASLSRIMKSCLEEYKDYDVNEIAGKYIGGQPQESAIPVLQGEDGTITNCMDTENRPVREGTVTHDIRLRSIAPRLLRRLLALKNIGAANALRSLGG